ncbi:prolyl oligopeptidase family serine peptidase [Balneolaceae bacterium ANBcel3]|nr:prolyl oligopeptidase family serine peptidase [Balneolaceae bacterium ANBcel3]
MKFFIRPSDAKTLFRLIASSTVLFISLVLVTVPVSGNSNHWTPEDIVRQNSAGSFAFSPDGKMVAWVKSRNSDEHDRKVTDIYLTRLDVQKDGEYLTLQLTRTEDRDTNPFFSEDGSSLYFLSSRGDGNALWSMSLYGGEPESVHSFSEGIRQVSLLDDGRMIFVSGEGDLLVEIQRKEKEDNTQVIEDTLTFKPSRLFVFDPDSKEVRRLTDNSYPIHTYAVSSDGRYAVTGHTRSPHYGADAQPPPSYYLRDLENGTRVRILDGLQTPGSFQFTDDNSGIYFAAVTSSDPEWSGAGISELYYLPVPEPEKLKKQSEKDGLPWMKVPLDWDWGLASGFNVIGNHVLASLANGPTRILAYYEHTGPDEWRKRIIETGPYDERVAIAAVSEDGSSVIFIHSTASVMPQYRIADFEVRRRSVRISNDRTLIQINRSLSDKYLAKTEIFRWTGAEDNEVNGILYYPENYDPERRYPLVVAIRGGPAAVTLDWWNMSWAYFPHILSQKESFVLMPNYHGSSNHGLEFVESIKGRYYELELVDIVRGIETLSEAGKVDMDSLGTMGWSNGSILSIALSIEYPEMFKAVGAGAGSVNWTSDYGTCRFGVRFDQSYFGGAPWDSTNGTFYNKAYIEKSPLFRMDQVIAPTIIFFGSEDRAVPRDQGWEHYRAMQQLDKAPVRFLWFPGQPHSLQKLTHQRRKLEEEIAWFDRYLFGTYQESNQAFKPDSPLAKRMKTDSLSTADGYYGVLNSRTLIPDTTPFGKDTLHISIFPVTNKQYHAFDSTHTWHPLFGNHPVRNIPADKAIAYTEWLSDHTGQRWRLPNESEAGTLHRTAHRAATGQNSLNALAGYDITREGALLLKEKIRTLRPESLILAVDATEPVKLGEGELYGLGGNVVEWYRNSSDQGGVYGYSPVHFADPFDPSRPEPLLPFTGFRVIREP